MRSFACAWILVLSLFGGGSPLPEGGSLVEVEEQEALRQPEREPRIRKQAVPAPLALQPEPAPSPDRETFRVPAAVPRVVLWIARTHERSPTS